MIVATIEEVGICQSTNLMMSACTYPIAMLLTFPSRESLRQAMDDGQVKIEWSSK